MTDAHDPFDDALHDLRVSGSVLLHESYASPWAIDVPTESSLRKTLGVASDVRVFPFHLVRKNGFTLQMRGMKPVQVEAPELCICPSGEMHRLSVGRGGPAVALDAVLAGRGPRLAPARDARATELVCGVFFARTAPLNPLIGALPRVVRVSTAGAETSPALAGVASLLLHELSGGVGGGFTVSRLLEILCAEAFRRFQRAAGATEPSWFRGLADPKVGEALHWVHREPAERWTVSMLARRVGLSPSRLAARFRETTGDSVMRYVASWRANVACRLLRESGLSLAEIAASVGYQSFPAFSRAFKTQLGVPPAAWRASLAANERLRKGW